MLTHYRNIRNSWSISESPGNSALRVSYITSQCNEFLTYHKPCELYEIRAHTSILLKQQQKTAADSSGEMEEYEEIVDEESMLQFCYLLQGEQWLTKSELDLLLDKTVPWIKRLKQLDTVLNHLLGPKYPPIGILVQYNVDKLSCLVEARKAAKILGVIGRELQMKYSTMGHQPDEENCWLWSRQVFPLGYMYVMKMTTDKTQMQQFSVEELNTTFKWRALLIRRSRNRQNKFCMEAGTRVGKR